MNRKMLIITLVMMLFAVQGYAQRERSEGRRGHRTEQRSGYRQGDNNRPSRRPQSVSQRRSSPQHSGYSRQRETPYRDRNYVSPERDRRPAPPVYHSRPAPVYRHHHSYYHHRHHCYFNDWYWYSWGGYRNRFICHKRYYNRFFDSMLGYYIWGALNAPTRLDIGNMSFTRYNSALQIRIGNQYTNLDLYVNQNIVYEVGHTTVNVNAGNGFAVISFYDEYGNQASYSL